MEWWWCCNCCGGGLGLELFFRRNTCGLCRCIIDKWMEFFFVGDPDKGGVVDR